MVVSVEELFRREVARGPKVRHAFTDENAETVRRSVKKPPSRCHWCGSTKTRMKARRADGKGFNYWERCDPCKERLEAQGGHSTFDGEELRKVLDKYGGSVDGYRAALKKAQKESPLLVPQDFLACPTCQGPLSIYREVRKDRGGAIRHRTKCVHCYRRKQRELMTDYRGGLTEKGELLKARQGLNKEERKALNQKQQTEKKRADRYAAQGWSKRTEQTYGLSQEDYLALLKKQNYQCAIDGCDFVHRFDDWFELKAKRSEIKGDKHYHHYLLVVDHCHDTGKVRGLLCSQCNLDVGTAEKVAKRGLQLQSLTDYVLGAA